MKITGDIIYLCAFHIVLALVLQAHLHFDLGRQHFLTVVMDTRWRPRTNFGGPSIMQRSTVQNFDGLALNGLDSSSA